MERHAIQRGDRVRTGVDRRQVTRPAADRRKDCFAGNDRVGDRSSRRRRQQSHEVGQRVDGAAVVVHCRRGIEIE